MTTLEIILTIAVITFIVYTICAIVFLVQFFKISVALGRFIKKTEQRLHPSLISLTHILEDVGKATSSVASLTGIHKIADSLSSVEKVVRTVYESSRENISETTRANIAGLKAGLRTGVITIIKNMRDKKEGTS